MLSVWQKPGQTLSKALKLEIVFFGKKKWLIPWVKFQYNFTSLYTRDCNTQETFLPKYTVFMFDGSKWPDTRLPTEVSIQVDEINMNCVFILISSWFIPYLYTFRVSHTLSHLISLSSFLPSLAVLTNVVHSIYLHFMFFLCPPFYQIIHVFIFYVYILHQRNFIGNT